jgi:hypothetical protein
MTTSAPLCQACRQPCRGGYVMNRSGYPVCVDEESCHASFAAFRAGAPKPSERSDPEGEQEHA